MHASSWCESRINNPLCPTDESHGTTASTSRSKYSWSPWKDYIVHWGVFKRVLHSGVSDKWTPLTWAFDVVLLQGFFGGDLDVRREAADRGLLDSKRHRVRPFQVASRAFARWLSEGGFRVRKICWRNSHPQKIHRKMPGRRLASTI